MAWQSLVQDDAINRPHSLLSLASQPLYFMKLNGDTVIDSALAGNQARFINHSCAPNCTTKVWIVGGEERIGVFALRDIPADTELTIDYCPSRAKSAPRSLRRVFLMPQVNPGSLQCCNERT